MRYVRCMILAGVSAIAGCYHPPYSYDVRANGEGGVVITTVPYRDEPWRQSPQPEIVYMHDAPAAATTAPAVATTVPATVPTTQPADQQDTADLQARIKALEAENARLKQQLPHPSPISTNPG